MAKALVVYATITGNNEDVADIITESFEDQGVEVDETEITMADGKTLRMSTFVSFVLIPMMKVLFQMRD